MVLLHTRAYDKFYFFDLALKYNSAKIPSKLALQIVPNYEHTTILISLPTTLTYVLNKHNTICSSPNTSRSVTYHMVLQYSKYANYILQVRDTALCKKDD